MGNFQGPDIPFVSRKQNWRVGGNLYDLIYDVRETG
jgi:hypothetical protein